MNERKIKNLQVEKILNEHGIELTAGEPSFFLLTKEMKKRLLNHDSDPEE